MGDPTAPLPSEHDETPPEVPDFELIRPIGQGGFGRVWLATNRVRLERELACDETALLKLENEERRDYGETILKLIDRFRHRPYLLIVFNEEDCFLTGCMYIFFLSGKDF